MNNSKASDRKYYVNELMAVPVVPCPIRYYVKHTELWKSKFPYNAVLQTRYGKGTAFAQIVAQVNKEFIAWLEEMLETLRVLPEDNVNAAIYHKIEELRVKYPRAWDGVGYYSRKMLEEYYIQGRIILDGEPISQEIVAERDRLIKERDEEYLRKCKEEEEYNAEQARSIYQRAMRQYYEDYRPVYVGYVFKNRDILLEAYRDITPKGLIKEKLAKIKEYIDVEYSNGVGWTVKELLREDTIGRVPPEYDRPRLNRE